MDMGTFNETAFKNTYSSKPSGGSGKKEKRRGFIDIISKIQMLYASEKNGLPLPADILTTGHIWDLSADIMISGLQDIFFTFILVFFGIGFLIFSKNLYGFHNFSILNYIIGAFMFAIPASVFSLILTSNIFRFYEKNLTNTAKLTKLVFSSFITIQILKFFVINIIFYGIFYAISQWKFFNNLCVSKIDFAIHGGNQKMFFLWFAIWKTLVNYKYKTSIDIGTDLLVSLFLVLTPPVFVFIFKHQKTKNDKQQNIVRGQALEDLTTQKPKKKSKKNYEIHNAEYDTRGTGVFGSNGTGKSSLLDYIIEDRMQQKALQKWMFVDITGEYMARYFRPGDIIIDITDKRCALWNLLEDVNSYFALQELSADIVPVSNDEKNRFFSDAARRAIYDALYECWHNHKLDNLSLKKQLLYQAKPYFQRIVELTGGASQSFTDVYQTYRNFIDPFLYLNTTGKSFKLSDWLSDEKDDRRLFLNLHEDSLQSQGRILNLFFVFFANKILAQTFKSAGRINVIIDEFANLNIISNLPRTLSLCRKKDVAFLLATQSAKEVHRIYGERFYNLSDNLNNKYVFRANDGETAKLLSDMFGKIEKRELTTNTAVSAAFKQEHTTTYSTVTKETNLVLSGDIQSLPDHNYFAGIVNKDGVRTIKFDARNKDFEPIKAINAAEIIYRPSNEDYHSQIEVLENEILGEEIKKAKESKKEKQKDQAIIKKDITTAINKVKKLADAAIAAGDEDDK